MDKQVILQYTNNFRRLFTPVLKPNVGMQIVSYPYDGGVLFVIELGFNIHSKDDFRSSANSLSEAMSRTNLFEAVPLDMVIPGTSILLINNKVVVIKNDDGSQWGVEAVNNDISRILEVIRDGQN